MVALGIFGALTKLKSAANDLPYTSQVALGLFGQCNAQASKVAHYQIIIIMYIYHALINALSAHMIHINLNMIFYTHVEHSPTKTIYIKYYKKNKK